MYNPTRLEWHLGDSTTRRTPEFFWWSCKAVNECLGSANRLLAASPRPRSPKEFGGFCFGQPNAERRWLGMRYPVTRANQSRESGLRIELGGSGKSLALCASKPFKSVQCDVMTRLRKATSKAKANPHFDAVRLCFVPTLTKRLHRDNYMRVCQCGGIVRQHELTGNREAWTCGDCGRYQIIKRGDECLKSSGKHGLKANEKVEKPLAKQNGSN